MANKLRDFPVDLEEPWTTDWQSAVSKLDVYYFFRLILGRLPSREEWTGHCASIGTDLTDALTAYLDSAEFKARGLTQFAPRDIRTLELAEFKMAMAANDMAVGAHLSNSGEYEPQVTSAVRKYVTPGMNAIDVGANVGYFTCLLASIVGPGGHVIAVEPGAMNQRFLILNRMLNGFNNVAIIHAAAGSRIESLAYNSSFSNGVASAYDLARPFDVLQSEPAFAVPLDLLIDPALPIHFVKIDVEGAEGRAIGGLMRTLEHWKPTIVSEFSPPALRSQSGMSGEEYLTTFARLGYRFVVLSASRPRSQESSITGVMRLFAEAGVDHIDVLMVQ